MLLVNQQLGQNVSFNSELANRIMKLNPKRTIQKLELSAEQEGHEMLRGTKMGNLITAGVVTVDEARKYLSEQLFAGRNDYIEGVNKTISKSMVEKLYPNSL